MSNRRDSIREAAARLFWQRGYEATSPRLIQKEAGAGQGSFYHHFGSKADLANDVLSEASSAMVADARSLLTGTDSPLAALRAYLDAERDPALGCRLGRLANETALADPQLGEPVAAYFAALLELLEARLAEARKRGEIQADSDTAALAAALAAAVQGAYVLARATAEPANLRRALAGARHLLDGLAQG